MAENFLEIVVIPAVARAQEHYFGRAMSVSGAPEPDPLPEDEQSFIAARDSFLHGRRYGDRLTFRAASRTESRFRRPTPDEQTVLREVTVKLLVTPKAIRQCDLILVE